jgi:hypothetical protein
VRIEAEADADEERIARRHLGDVGQQLELDARIPIVDRGLGARFGEGDGGRERRGERSEDEGEDQGGDGAR